MTLFDWLVTPQGQALVNAVIVVLVAAAGFLSYLAKRQSSSNAQLLNGHIQQHEELAVRDMAETLPVAPLTPAE